MGLYNSYMYDMDAKAKRLGMPYIPELVRLVRRRLGGQLGEGRGTGLRGRRGGSRRQ